jgi:hypothetical protein
MPQIFHRSFNTLSKVSILGTLILLAFLGWALYVVGWSPYVTQAHIARVQPVPFSHAHPSANSASIAATVTPQSRNHHSPACRQQRRA